MTIYNGSGDPEIKDNRRMIWTIVSVAMAIALGAFLCLQALDHQREATLGEESVRINREMASYIEVVLKRYGILTAYLAATPDVIHADGDAAARERMLSSFEKLRQADPHIMYVYLGTEHRNMWMRPEDTLPTGYDPTARPWYKSAESAGKVVYTDPYFDSSTGKLVTTIACPVVVNKETIGVVSVDVDFSEIDKSFSAWTRYDKNGTRLSFIVDSTNAITSAYPEMKALNRAQLSSGPLLEAMKPETDESMMTMNVNLAEIAKPSTDPEAEPSSSPIQGDYGRCIVTVERISDMELKLVTITKDPSLFEMFGKFQ